MFRPSRERRDGEDRFLVWKVRIFVIGAAVAFVGIGMSLSWLVWAGIGILLVGLALRFLPDGRRGGSETRGRDSTEAGTGSSTDA